MESTPFPDVDETLNQAFDEKTEPPPPPPPPRTRFQNADEAHTKASRWWFASSAFPMIAGTLGPVASAFSICSLVRPWRQRIPKGTSIQDAPFVNDPLWLTVINAVQLFIAISSNLALLLNMARRLRFSIAQPITIIGWFISAFSLIALAATAAGPLALENTEEDTYVWSQAFFYGIYAAILYLSVSSLMVITIYGSWKGHYPKDFNLNSSQRTLMLQTILFLLYLLVGALIFSHTEDWPYLDAVYWADVTLFTIGFGDFGVESPLGRALLFPYALLGVIALGLVIGSIRSLALERGSNQLDARFVEKKRRHMLKKLEMRGGSHILRPILGMEKRAHLDDLSANFMTEYERREQEFLLMRKIQEAANKRRSWVALAISLITWMILWLVGAYIFLECEKPYQDFWTYYDAFYFAFVSFTTIGYGDRTPISNAGKSFLVFWSLLALPTMTILISNAGDTVIKWIRESTLTLGNLTILPGEQSFKSNIRAVLVKLSCGILFQENIKTTAPGFLGESNQTYDADFESGVPRRDSSVSNTRNGTNNSADTHTTDNNEITITPAGNEGRSPVANTRPGVLKQRPDTSDEGFLSPLGADPDAGPYSSSSRPGTSTSAAHGDRRNSEVEGGHVMHRRMTHKASTIRRSPSMTIIPNRLPATREGYHCALINEISRVTRHVKGHTDRKYTFAEWSWFLALIGEDEASADTHRAVHNDGASEMTHMTETNQRRIKWSWVGKRSPLMGSMDEPEWVLEQLTWKLADELEEVQKEAQQGMRRY